MTKYIVAMGNSDDYDMYLNGFLSKPTCYISVEVESDDRYNAYEIALDMGLHDEYGDRLYPLDDMFAIWTEEEFKEKFPHRKVI